MANNKCEVKNRKKPKKISGKTGNHSKEPVEVVIEDVSTHPTCLHGPTLLLSSQKGRFFACSAIRNGECTLRITEEDWERQAEKNRNKKYLELIPKLDKAALWKVHTEIRKQHESARAYCITCNQLYITTANNEHIKHRTVNPITDTMLKQPWSTWLPAITNDGAEAQYMFTKRSVTVLLNMLKKNNIGNMLCIGTPSVHEAASTHNFSSLLLDFDTRLAWFHPPHQFLWYNMFNNHLFGGRDDELVLKKFFLSSQEKGLCIVIDPPFGGRVEPLVHTLRELSETYNSVCGGEGLLPVVWAFPYFSEPYIVNSVPEIRMHDYQVEYDNHTKFQNSTNEGRKHGSPVRFFTNLPLSSIDLSKDDNYKLCNMCKYYTAKTNKHCHKCNQCTSKNGMTYQHCDICKRCVKPTFFHCGTCKRCCQKREHVCGVVVTSQSCYNCNQKGHKRSMCPNKVSPAKKLKA